MEGGAGIVGYCMGTCYTCTEALTQCLAQGGEVLFGLLRRLGRICGVRYQQEARHREGDLDEPGEEIDFQDQAQESNPPPHMLLTFHHIVTPTASWTITWSSILVSYLIIPVINSTY